MTLIEAFLVGGSMTFLLWLFTKPGPPAKLCCGLIGFSGGYSFDIDKIKLLFMYNESRGSDSCGYYTESGKDTSLLKKKVGKASALLVTEDMVGSKILIGHTRKSTMGTVNEINAHPFKYSNVAGAHNGVLTNHYYMADTRNLEGSEWNIDSQVLYRSMEKDIKLGKLTAGGEPLAYTKVIQDYAGGAALVFSLNDGKLYCYHDKDRPLFHGRIKISGKVGTYVSSIKESLIAIGCSKVREFPEEMVYVFENGNLKETVKIERKPISRPPYTYNANNYNPSKVTDFNDDLSTDTRTGVREVWNGHEWVPKERVGDTIKEEALSQMRGRYPFIVGEIAVPSEKGKEKAWSIASKVKSVKIMKTSYIDKLMTVKIMELINPNDATNSVGDEYNQIPMEFFQPIIPIIMGPATKPEEASASCEIVEETTDADVKIDAPATKKKEESIEVTDFDDVKEQVFVVLTKVRDRLKKVENYSVYEINQEVRDIREEMEQDIYTLFTINS